MPQTASAPSVMAKLEEADKLLRRGELAEARACYQALLAQAPPELAPQLLTRIGRVEELLDPAESVSRKGPDTRTSAPQRAESCYNDGQLEEAVKIYAQLVAQRPDDQLAAERMAELQAELDHNARDAAQRAARRAPVGPALDPVTSVALPKPVTTPLPRDPVEMLKELLARITAHARPRPA